MRRYLWPRRGRMIVNLAFCVGEKCDRLRQFAIPSDSSRLDYLDAFLNGSRGSRRASSVIAIAGESKKEVNKKVRA